MRGIDFFCGAGGLTRGLLDAGINIIAGIDADGACRKTYEANNRPSLFHEVDIRELTEQMVRQILRSRVTSDLLFAACAPCQPFSQHKNTVKTRVDECDEDRRETRTRPQMDATLLGAFARLVEDILPAHILVENVPGLVKVRGFSTYRRFKSMLIANSYNISEGIIDAKHYAVPQTRRRYILIASRRFVPRIPERLCGNGRKPYLTVRDAIAHFPEIAAGQEHSAIPNHTAALLSPLNARRIAETPKDGGDRRSWQAELELDCHKGKHEGHTDVYGRMRWDSPAPTLTGKCNSLSNGRYGHPCQDRAITLREAASIQTFSDSYVFFGFKRHIAQQIGNAVPVHLAEVLGRELLERAEQSCLALKA